MRQPLQLTLGIALHLLLIVAVVQAWTSGWPGRIWLTVGALLALVASGALVRRWRSAPLLIGCIAVAMVFLWPALRYGPDASGLKIGGVPFGAATAALIIVALAIAAEQLWMLASTPRLPRWVRFIPAAFALYAIALIGLGIGRGATTSGLVGGGGPLPWWISGPYLGTAVLLPLALLVSVVLLGIAVARRRAGVVTAVAVFVVMLAAFALSGLELTRNGRPNLGQFIVPASFVGATSSRPQVTDAPTVLAAGLGAGKETLAPYEGKDLDEIFARVATGVRYEPYSGIQRGAIGTAVARSGNSADKSMLLAEVLRGAGYKVRYARGTLADNNIDAVIEGMYPPGTVDPQLAADYVPYNPTADAVLRDAVRAHMWVEVYQGSTWLPMDPSFPRAKVGETYAVSMEQFEKPADALFQTIQATLREERENGQVRELSRFQLNVADIGFKPITLVVRAIPQSTGGDAPKGGSMGSPAGAMGGMGGALGGAAEPPKPAKKTEEKIVGVAYVRALRIGNAPQKVARTTVLDAQPQTRLRREWIEFNLAAPGGPSRRIERVLYQSDGASLPAEHRIYSISVIAGRVTRTFADQQTRLARTLIDPKAMQQKASGLSGISPDDPKATAVAIELETMASAAGTVGGQLLALRFAAESDSISRLIADGSGIALSWAVPRILIVGVEVASGKDQRINAKVDIDLRLDEVKAYPYRGAPTRLAKIFQAARGIQESVIEGGLVAVATGRVETANTAQVMRAAEDGKVPLLVINASTRSRIPELITGLPGACMLLMNAALNQGREIVIPSRAVALAGGAPQFGWWEVDPSSGAIVGVMQSGAHQGMTEYAFDTEEVGLNDKTARQVGMIVGTLTTVGTLSALLLEYGDVTPELVGRLEVYVKKVMCVSCFDKVEAKVEISAGGDCLKEELKQEKVIGAASISFCDNYYKGFKCTASLIIANLKGEGFKQFDKVEIAPGIAAGCEEVDLPKFEGSGSPEPGGSPPPDNRTR